MTQNARVARWVPTTVNAISDTVLTTETPRPQDNAIPTIFAAQSAGGGATIDWATDADMAAGTDGLKVVSPNTLRDEQMRQLGIPEANFADPIAIVTPSGNAALDANRMVKTAGNGLISTLILPPIPVSLLPPIPAALLPSIIDAGTF
jgi:hypothetical protein